MGFCSLWISGSILVLFSLIMLGACQDNCPTTKCGSHGPDIRFPFRLRGEQQPKHCSYPGFELSCKDGHTVLDLPTPSGEIFVKSISYVSQTLRIFNPHNCDAALLFDLNFTMSRLTKKCIFNNYTNTPSPFHYAPRYEDEDQDSFFTFCDCSLEDDAKEGFLQIPSPCMSSSGHYYILHPSESLDGLRPSCTSVKTVCTPSDFRDYLDYGFADDPPLYTLSWDRPECRYCESLGKACGFNETTGELGCYYKPWHGKGALMKRTITGDLCFSIDQFVFIHVFK
ncbi:hypothetical protein NE237_014226 [Protea cynaroides]|uniref:RING-type E3 ubiquitin transferase n=1 Tax=Protea cynaroides TaxID=273540 RepID=A0A9Q0JS60_9MAGN|nr:hypothetical protein NE237_014226 [Protea cynaroides]